MGNGGIIASNIIDSLRKNVKKADWENAVTERGNLLFPVLVLWTNQENAQEPKRSAQQTLFVKTLLCWFKGTRTGGTRFWRRSGCQGGNGADGSDS